MQFFNTVCAVLCLALLVSAETNTCSHPGEEEEANYLTTEALGCTMNVTNGQEEAFRAANTTDDYQRAVKLSCDQHEAYSQCMEGLKTEARACLHGYEQDRVILDLELKTTDFEVICMDDGRSFALFNEEQRKSNNLHSESGPDVYSKCRLGASAVVSHTLNLNNDPNHSTLYEYRLIRQTVTCMESHRGEGEDALVDAGKVYMTHLMDRLKCFDENKHYILCKTLVDNTAHSPEEH